MLSGLSTMLKLSHILSETNPINTEKFSIIDMSTHLDAQTIMPTDEKDLKGKIKDVEKTF